jgi:hypothetical protein
MTKEPSLLPPASSPFALRWRDWNSVAVLTRVALALAAGDRGLVALRAEAAREFFVDARAHLAVALRYGGNSSSRISSGSPCNNSTHAICPGACSGS